jgi:hypothetical protein
MAALPRLKPEELGQTRFYAEADDATIYFLNFISVPYAHSNRQYVDHLLALSLGTHPVHSCTEN